MDRMLERRVGKPASGELFSLGAVLARRWRPAVDWLPWACVAGVLAIAGCWDWFSRGASPDFVLLGLAAYELAVGLTEGMAVQLSDPFDGRRSSS